MTDSSAPLSDLVNFGATCSFEGCQIHDFLPATCAHCHRVMCSSHVATVAHACPGSTIPCEFCQSDVPLKVYLAHRQVCVAATPNANSQTAVKAQEHVCVVPGCTADLSVFRISCNGCRRDVCLKHKTFEAHSCISVRLSGTASGSKNALQNAAPEGPSVANDDDRIVVFVRVVGSSASRRKVQLSRKYNLGRTLDILTKLIPLTPLPGGDRYVMRVARTSAVLSVLSSSMAEDLQDGDTVEVIRRSALNATTDTSCGMECKLEDATRANQRTTLVH